MTREALDEAVRKELAEVLAFPGHIVYYNTRYDGRGGIAWKDDGGISCLCGWSAPPEGNRGRPWNAWRKHQADVLAPTVARLLDEARAEVRERVEAACCACGGDGVRYTVGADRKCPVHGYGDAARWSDIRAALADPEADQ